MVKQQHQSKTSSESEYSFPAYITPGGFLPETIETKAMDKPDSTGAPGYIISGTFRDEAEDWASPQPPHIAFANLRVGDPQSAKAFIQRYGRLYEGRRGLYMSDDPTKIRQERAFTVSSDDLRGAQLELRDAWEGGPSIVTAMEAQVEEDMAADVVVAWRSVQLRPRDLWTSICFLFLMDHTAGKIGLCKNPDCPAPYFRKKRKTQKFCEAGPCVAYAQRQYSLNWWNREGKKRRKKKMAKRQH